MHNMDNSTTFGQIKVVALKGEKGDMGDAGDYAGLANKPSINGVQLNGNQSDTQLGLASQAEVDQLISQVGSGGVTTLWSGSITARNASASLSDDITEYDFIDIYYGHDVAHGDSTTENTPKYVRVPVSGFPDIVNLEMSMADGTAGSSAYEYLFKTTLQLTDNDTLTITDTKEFFWAGHDIEEPAEILVNPWIEIYRIDGVKLLSGGSDTAEVQNIRIGVDGTTYPSAGDAVRGQVTDLQGGIDDLKEDLNNNSETLYNELSADVSVIDAPSIYATSNYTSDADGAYYVSNRIIKKGSFIKSIKVYNNTASNNGNVILIDSNNTVVYKRSLNCYANSWNTLHIGIIAPDDVRFAISTASAYKSNVPSAYGFADDGLYKLSEASVDVGDTVTVTKTSTSIVGFATQFKYYEGQPIKDIVVGDDAFINNSFLYSVPKIKESYSNNSDGSFYISDRIIPANSVITDVTLIAGEAVSTDNFIVFFNSDNEVVYVEEYSLALQGTNVISINHLFEENVHFGVCGSIKYDTSVADDYRFCLSTGLYKASSNDVPDVGDTISYSSSSTAHFGFAIQINYLHYDRSASSKSDRPISGYENFSVTVNYADYTADADETPSEYTDYGVIALPSSYSPNGEPTRLIILCGGTGERIASNTNPLTFPGWNYFLAKGYAVMDVNGMASAWGTAYSFPVTNQHYCNKYLLDSYSEAYKHVMSKYNLKHDIFVAGISMGGGAAALIVQSNILPVKANVLFCPALSVFKQDYMQPWNATPTDQQKTIAGQWGFPNWSTETPSQSYFLANYDKVVGFDNLMIRTFGDVQTALENYGNTAEENAFNTLSKVYPVPVKVWHCEDDSTVYYRYSQFFVRMIKNAGGQAWLRTYASGGHSGGWATGSVTDAGVTTSKNFYEAVLFLKQFE